MATRYRGTGAGRGVLIGRRASAGWIGAGLAVMLAAGFTLTACAGSAASQIDYVVDGPLSTYNTNTVAGAASAGAQAFARTLTGFSYHGPDGQIVADRDFGTISVVGGTPLVLDYQIADNAVYSDGKPVTCDDIVLAWAAQSGKFPDFHAATQAGYVDIANVECMPGQKKARVSFVPDRGVVDYTQLFTATSMMPSHVIADQLNVDVTAALLSNNGPWSPRSRSCGTPPGTSSPGSTSSASRRRGRTRSNRSWMAARWCSSPTTGGGGPSPSPSGSPCRRRAPTSRTGSTAAASTWSTSRPGSSGTLTTPDNYERSDWPSAGVEQLIFAPQGPLAAPKARRAVALCTPRDTLANDAGDTDRQFAPGPGHR